MDAASGSYKSIRVDDPRNFPIRGANAKRDRSDGQEEGASACSKGLCFEGCSRCTQVLRKSGFTGQDCFSPMRLYYVDKAFNLVKGTTAQGTTALASVTGQRLKVKKQESTMRKLFEKVVPGKNGLAVELTPGQHLRIVDLEGQQVIDMALFNLDNLREKLSTSYSRTRYVNGKPGVYVPRDHLSESDILLSTLCRPMMPTCTTLPR